MWSFNVIRHFSFAYISLTSVVFSLLKHVSNNTQGKSLYYFFFAREHYLKSCMAARTVEKGGRGGKRSRARAPRWPVNILYHTILLLLYISAMHFYGDWSALKGYLQEPLTFDDSFHVRNQTVVSIFLIYRNCFYPSESLVGVVGSLSFRSHSFFSAFESLIPSSTSSDCNHLVWTRHY